MKKIFITIAFLLAFSLQWVPSARIPRAFSKAELFGIQLSACSNAWAASKPDKCKLYGKIKIVDSFPDVTVKVVDSFPDIKVKIVDSFPDAPGKWKYVDSFPDYKVKFVSSFPDYKIKFVDSFPGCN